MKDRNQTYPAFCPICTCPIQKLMGDSSGGTRGTIRDAMRAHYRTVHPEEKDRPE